MRTKPGIEVEKGREAGPLFKFKRLWVSPTQI